MSVMDSTNASIGLGKRRVQVVPQGSNESRLFQLIQSWMSGREADVSGAEYGVLSPAGFRVAVLLTRPDEQGILHDEFFDKTRAWALELGEPIEFSLFDLSEQEFIGSFLDGQMRRD